MRMRNTCVVVLVCMLVGISGAYAGGANEKPVTLTLFTSVGSWVENTGFQASIKKYQELFPNVKIEVQASPKFEEVLPVKIASGDLPDVSWYHGGTGTYRQLNAEANLVAFNDPAFTANVIPSIVQDNMLNGKLYGIPYGDLTVSGVVYNKAAFEKAGIKKLPTTKTEFYATCDALKKAGIIPMVFSGKEGWSIQVPVFDWCAAFLTANKNWIKDINTRKTTLDKSPEFIAALTNMKEMKDLGYMNEDTMSTSYQEVQDYLGTGKAAMFDMGLWVEADLMKKFPDVKLGFFPLPYDDKLAPAAAGYGSGALITFVKSKNQDAAKAFIKWAVSADGYKTFYDNFNGIPVAKGITVKLNPIGAEAVEYVKKGQTSENIGGQTIAALGDWMSALQDILLGKATPQQAAERTQAEITKNAKATKMPGWEN